MNEPNVHLFDDGGGLVTRCQDVKVARRLLVRKYIDDCIGLDLADPECVQNFRQDIAWASRQFRPHKAKVGHGRIVPAQPADDVSWWWRAGDGQVGQRGVTRAVWWDAA